MEVHNCQISQSGCAKSGLLIQGIMKCAESALLACADLASFPGLEEEDEPFVNALNYLEVNDVSISGRLPVTPSKSHG